MNKAAYDRMEAPEAFQLLYDGPNNAIAYGLRSNKNATAILPSSPAATADAASMLTAC